MSEMANSGAPEKDQSPPAKSATDLKKELMGHMKSIIEKDDGWMYTYKEALKALDALKDLKFPSSSASTDKRSSPLSIQKQQIEPVDVPKHFLCPISGEIMKDPVIIASGQTYDRPFIQEWLNSGNRTCPQTEEVLSNILLTPNVLVRTMISHWCRKHGIDLPLLKNYEEGLVTRGDWDQWKEHFEKLSVLCISERKQAVKRIRLLTKSKQSIRALIGQNPEAIPKLCSVLDESTLRTDEEAQEDVVTTILNLSIHDDNKKIVGDNPKAIPMLIHALKTGNMVTRSNSAAALFTLSALNSNKIKIVKLGALKPLAELLEQGSPTAKKDAASAIFNLCMAHENRNLAVSEGVVDATLKAIMDHSLVDESLTILALLSGNAAAKIAKIGGVSWLLDIIRDSPIERNRENATVILYSITTTERGYLMEIRTEEESKGTISKLVHNGTSRASRKASTILERLNRVMPKDYFSCEM